MEYLAIPELKQEKKHNRRGCVVFSSSDSFKWTFTRYNIATGKLVDQIEKNIKGFGRAAAEARKMNDLKYDPTYFPYEVVWFDKGDDPTFQTFDSRKEGQKFVNDMIVNDGEESLQVRDHRWDIILPNGVVRYVYLIRYQPGGKKYKKYKNTIISHSKSIQAQQKKAETAEKEVSSIVDKLNGG